MDIVFSFIIFILCIAVFLSMGITMILPLGIGLMLFGFLAFRRGYSVKNILAMMKDSTKESFIVIGVLLLIGCLTGLWRACGTVAYFVVTGMKLIPPTCFLLAAFLLSSAMSFALGTSFGVTATAGVILMSIARASGINPIAVGGAVMSGVYVGDRGSPASSSANLVAAVTDTDFRINLRKMLKTSIIPFVLCCIIYAFLSPLFPGTVTDSSVLQNLSEAFHLNWLCLIPAVLIIGLPFAGLKVKVAMAISIAASFCLAVFEQKLPVTETIKAMLLGFETSDEVLSSILNGGGVQSMLEVCVILLIAGFFGGIFRTTGMLEPLHEKICTLEKKIGRFLTMVLTSLASCMVFCNQTIGIMMLNQFSDGLYNENEKYEKMLDMENTVICLAGLVPWCIACSVPLSMMNVGIKTLAFSYYLWLIPLWNGFVAFLQKKQKQKGYCHAD